MMINISKTLILLLITSLLVQSCKSLQKTVKPTDANINGNWSLVSLNGEKAEVIFEEETPSININQARKLISGISGCNNFSGHFSFKDGIFEAPDLMKTLMICIHKNDDKELLEAIRDKSKVYIKDGLLTFEKEGKIVVQFEKGIENSLLSGEWILKSMDGHSAENLFSDNIPTLDFLTVEKNISGSSGCNQYNANYNLNGFILKVGAIISTRKACEYSANETEFIQAISDESTISLNADTLTLSKKNKKTLQFIKQQ